LLYIIFKKTVSNLTIYNNNFNLKKYFEFLSISKDMKEKVETDSKAFSEILLKLMKKVNLLLEILKLLIEYYHNTYNFSFIILSNIHNSSLGLIIVFLKVK